MKDKNLQTKFFRTIREIMWMLAIAAVMSGCGTPADRDGDLGGGVFSPPPITAGGTNPAPFNGNTLPPLQYSVEGVGYTQVVQFTANVRNVLRIRYTPGQVTTPVGGTGFLASYSQFGAYIKLEASGTAGNGTTELDMPTPLMHNGLVQPAQSSGVMDFSSGLDFGSTDSDSRHQVTITIHMPNYDYWCFILGYCNPPYTHVYETSTGVGHPWIGTLEIETDDTQALSLTSPVL